MLAIEVEFLMGRAVASEWQERTRAEWPPHPQRLFSALVATYHDLKSGPAGEAALRWLEALPAPEIRATPHVSHRSVPSHWVPVNDETIKADKGQADHRHVLDRRNRQERFFPAAVPEDPIVVFQWPQATGVEEHRPVLRSIVENLSYVGHSSSPVRACLRDDPVESTLRPSIGGEYALRVPGPGRFDRLSSVHQLRLDDESVQPPLGRTQGYALKTESVRSIFSPDAVVLAFEDGPKLGLDSTLPLMQHLRGAVLSRLGSLATETLTGHDDDGQMSLDAHLAFVPLGYVNSRYADGSLKGAALLLPRTADDLVRRRLRGSLGGGWKLHLGPLGSISLRSAESSGELRSLRFATYTRPSQFWASVTPVVFDRFPKKNGVTAEAIIAESCRRIGLPLPIEVGIGSISALSGVPRAMEFHGSAKQVDNRLRQHVWLRFDQTVTGPVLVGAGRFIGLGLCAPFQPERAP